jgi:hypothetical protein
MMAMTTNNSIKVNALLLSLSRRTGFMGRILCDSRRSRKQPAALAGAHWDGQKYHPGWQTTMPVCIEVELFRRLASSDFLGTLF